MKITQVVLTVPYEGEMGGRIKNAKKKRGGKSPQLNHGVNCNCFQQGLKEKWGSTDEAPSTFFLRSSASIHTSHTQKKKSKLLR